MVLIFTSSIEEIIINFYTSQIAANELKWTLVKLTSICDNMFVPILAAIWRPINELGSSSRYEVPVLVLICGQEVKSYYSIIWSHKLLILTTSFL